MFDFVQAQPLPVSHSYDEIMVNVKKENNSSVENSQTPPIRLDDDVIVQSKPKDSEKAEGSADDTIQKSSYDADIENLSKQVAQEAQTSVSQQSQKSGLMIFVKFLLAMIWVVISSIVIFIILVSYKKLILNKNKVSPTYESLAESLDSPKNFKEAIKIFLDKTKW